MNENFSFLSVLQLRKHIWRWHRDIWWWQKKTGGIASAEVTIPSGHPVHIPWFLPLLYKTYEERIKLKDCPLDTILVRRHFLRHSQDFYGSVRFEQDWLMESPNYICLCVNPELSELLKSCIKSKSYALHFCGLWSANTALSISSPTIWFNSRGILFCKNWRLNLTSFEFVECLIVVPCVFNVGNILCERASEQ